MGRNTDLQMECNSLNGSKKCFCASSGSIASAGSSSSSRSSGGGGGGGGSSGKHGLRTVHLKRQCGYHHHLDSGGRCIPNPKGSTFGFSFRGGREFGTGFFVSAVENDSEAHRRGLKIGDQIVRINGLSVEDATHQEVLQLAQSHHQLTLTVKSVGLIPVKDKSEDPLTWKVVENGAGIDDSPVVSVGSDIDRVRIEIPENGQLGCGICKGPDWRPGIFIQYTKPNSLARRCGLQPGDQILQCNRISFLQIDFSYAVTVLKNTRTLDLVLKKGSGIDLFPGESSGYSSSSSIADESVNPTASKAKRLSIVAEESEDRHHRKTCLCRHSRRNGALKPSGSVDSVFECIPDGDGSRYRERSKSIEILTDATAGKKTVTFKNRENVSRTLLNITKPRDSCHHHCLVGNQTVIKIESNDIGREMPLPPSMSVEKKIGESLISVEVHRSNEEKVLSSEESQSASSFSSGSSLSSAINQEIQRRNERKLKGLTNSPRQEFSKSRGKQNRQQHDLLIAELKKKQGCEEKTSTVSTQTDAEKQPATEPQLPEVTKVTVNGSASSAAPRREIPPACPTPDYSSDASATDQSFEASHTVKNSILKFEERTRPPGQKTVTFGRTSTKEIAPIGRGGSGCGKMSDRVEMDSLDSCELTEPRQVAPKPPPVYFGGTGAAGAAQEGKKRTTVIRITEYPTERRREPGRFDFLRDNRDKEARAFESELASTLSRSNLRSKMEAFANVANGVQPGTERFPPAGRTARGQPPPAPPTFIPATVVTENQLTNAKKTLKALEGLEKTRSTVLVKMPKRN